MQFYNHVFIAVVTFKNEALVHFLVIEVYHC